MVYAIIKYYIEFSGERCTAYGKVTDPTWTPKDISPKEAKRIIKEEGLILVESNEYGKIWDFPDLRWTNKWKGIFAKRAAEALLKQRIKMSNLKNKEKK